MTYTNYYVGVDIGTTSTKAVLFGEHGKVIQMQHVEYPLYSPPRRLPNKIRMRFFKRFSIRLEKSFVKLQSILQKFNWYPLVPPCTV